MVIHLRELGTVAVLIAGLIVSRANVSAQTSTKSDAVKTANSESNGTPKGEKSPHAGPFHGKLAALDKAAKTITVGKRTFQITSETKIKRGGKAATLDQGVVGEEVSGYVKPTDGGKWLATTVNLGPKAEGQGSEKRKTTADAAAPHRSTAPDKAP